VLAVTALLVICSRSHSVITGVSALLLAHFLTYPHVWEHHMSGVCVVGAMLLTVPNRNRTSTGVVVFSLCLLALPTPFVFFDVGKDPTVWDPSGQWPEFVSYLLAPSKALPCVLLYLHAVVGLWKAGLLPPRAVLRSALVRAS
jgi:hypothetical protein